MRLYNTVILLAVLFCFSCAQNTQRILLIGNTKVDCKGLSTDRCLQIKEEGQTDWSLFYNPIEGFEYQEGLFYKIKVEISEVDHPSQDASALRYKLVEVVEESKVPLNLDQGAWLVTQIADQHQFGRNPFIRIDLSRHEINGNTSCNRFSGAIEVIGQDVDIKNLSSTEMMCQDIEVEVAFLKALNEVSSYALTDGKLQFLDKDKQLLMTCKYLKSE